eukprot:gene23920-biopygen15635
MDDQSSEGKLMDIAKSNKSLLYKRDRYELATAKDADGRCAMNIASEKCQRLIKESTYFCKRDLNRIITNEHIAGKDWGQVKSIAVEIARALQHIHSSGTLHGDVKSKNIMRIGHHFKFIDFDASVRIGNDFVGAKYSSAFVPPEMVFFRERTNRILGPLKTENSSSQQLDKKVSEWKQYSGRYFEDVDNICIKAYNIDPTTGEIVDMDKMPFELNIAHESEDNILYEAMLDLYAFTDKYKKKRMLEIQNLEARNLLAQMLTRNPLKRPKMSQVLAHPFLSGKKSTRMLGESAQFDVFLSYRKQSDEQHAQLLYTKLTDAGLLVWWDKKSLIPGVPWQEGFCDGLVKSLVFLPILSRDAINNSSVEKQNFTLLSRSSNCDNLLLEHRLALEFLERGLLESIYPVLVGDIVTNTTITGTGTGNNDSYTDYFLTDCHPKCTNHLVVESVETALQEHLSRLCFGTPLLENMFVPVILDHIVKNQGGLVEGPSDIAFDAIIDDMLSIVEEKKRKKASDEEGVVPVVKYVSRASCNKNVVVLPLNFSTLPTVDMKDESMAIYESLMTVEDLV